MPAMAALPEGIVAYLLTDLEGSTRLWERDSDSEQDSDSERDWDSG